MLISHPRVLLDPQFGVPQTPTAFHEVGGEVCWWGEVWQTSTNSRVLEVPWLIQSMV